MHLLLASKECRFPMSGYPCVAPYRARGYNPQARDYAILSRRQGRRTISMEVPTIPTDGDENSPLTSLQQLEYAREIIRLEAGALLQLADRIDAQFVLAISQIYNCQTNVIVTGMGKAGLVGQKIAATLASTGTRSHFLNPAEAFHGDLGRIHHGDVVLVLSQSGHTEEIVRLLPSLEDLRAAVVAITTDRNSPLGQAANVVLELGPLQEACSLGLAPSTSTTAMLALGDALALVTSKMRAFRAEDFARFHPGGSLGRKLTKVEQLMRPVRECRWADQTETLRSVLSKCCIEGRRSGAVMIVDSKNQLSGVFTDSDLARLFERHQESALDQPIHNVMSRHPVTVPSGSMVSDAVAIMAERKLSELPVIDDSGTPLGLLDITDLVNRNFVDKESAQTQDHVDQADTTNPGCVPYPKLCAESKVERARDTADIPDFTKRKKRRSG